MSRRLLRVCVPGLVAVLVAGCGGQTVAAPTAKPTPAPLAAPGVSVVKAALVAAADVPGSSVGEAPTGGTESALATDGLVPSPCIKATGIITTTRTAVGSDVSQPLSVAAKAVTEAVILESKPADTVTDIGEETAGARACPAHDEDSTGQFGDSSVSTSSVIIGAWTGTRTTAQDTFTSGVTRVASYVYFLSLNGGLMVLQLGVAFANVAPTGLYQQQADEIVSKLSQRLAAIA